MKKIIKNRKLIRLSLIVCCAAATIENSLQATRRKKIDLGE